MHQATRVRFRGGDPLALTKRIQARREAHCCGMSYVPARDPIEPTVTSWKEAWTILWQAGLLIVLFVGIAWTGPIFAEVVLAR